MNNIVPLESDGKNSYHCLSLLKKLYFLDCKSQFMIPSLKSIGTFFTNHPQFSEVTEGLWQFYDKILIREIGHANEEELFHLTKFSLDYLKSGKWNSFGIGISKMNANLMARLRLVLTNPTHNGYMKLLLNIKKAHKLHKSFEFLAQYTIENALDFIQNDKITSESQSSIINLAKDWHILKKIEVLPYLSSQFLYNLKEFKKEFNPIAKKEKLSLVDVDFKDEESIKIIMPKASLFINYSDIKTKGNSISTKFSEKQKIISNVYKGDYNNKSVCLKIYRELNKNCGDFKSVEEEINIYEKLSKISNENNCFLKYYGTSIISEDSYRTVYLVMQNIENSLLDYIVNKSNNIQFEEKLKKIFTNLLSSFIELHNMKIYHLDIKPTNILIEEDKPYIIDFDVSITKNDNQTYSFQVENKIFVGTKGYAAPEIQEAVNKGIIKSYKLHLADAFSLGMTFFHMIVGNDFQDNLNTREMEQYLIDRIKNIKYEWAKPLLFGLLDFDCDRRLDLVQAQNLVKNNNQTVKYEIEDENSNIILQKNKKAPEIPKERKKKLIFIEDGEENEEDKEINDSSKSVQLIDVRIRVLNAGFDRIQLCLKKTFKKYREILYDYRKRCELSLPMNTKRSQVLETTYHNYLRRLFEDIIFYSKFKIYNDFKQNTNLPIYSVEDFENIGLSLKSRKINNIITNTCVGKIKDKKVYLKIFQVTTNDNEFIFVLNEVIKQENIIKISKLVYLQELVGIVESFESDMKSIMLITPFIEHNLKDVIKICKIWPKNKKEHFTGSIFRILLESFKNLHSFGIFHLDISPENVLMEKIKTKSKGEEKWKPYITEFDLNVYEKVSENKNSRFDYKNYVKNYGFIDPAI
ncbi:hypothetical protein SteCoe_29048 [Stentor coeruleus]|uniref:Protein kinase domain-containing protein n=1 Tax=Stentor coeruleus TaxID=5963 RepID=A0A1R2B769_9CILI|nr:hypothetical protein SteCoe_29048 [Stentor coeruleus]